MTRYETEISLYALGNFSNCGDDICALSATPAHGQILFFDNFQQFANGTDLSSAGYTPASARHNN